MKKRYLAAAGLLAASTFAAYDWQFSEVEHRRVTSPDGLWVVVVMKRMLGFIKPVEIRLKAFENGGRRRMMLDTCLDLDDCWDDIHPNAFQVEWKSAIEFHVTGGRHPRYFLGRLSGELWTVDLMRNGP